jgi:hypothetical protein
MLENEKMLNIITTCDGTPYKEKIEIGFPDILPKLPTLVRNQYEQDIIKNGVPCSLDVWVTNTDPVKYVLVKGHIEFETAMKHALPFNITLHHFESKDDVIRFIIKGTLFQVNLNTFQKGELILRYKHLFTEKGRANMRKGGKGIKTSEKVDTMVALAQMIGKSHDTLRKIETILKKIKKTDKRLQQLRGGEVTINNAFEEISGKKKTRNFLELVKQQNETDPTNEFPVIPKPLIKSRFHIDEQDKYQAIYMKPRWSLSDSITLPDPYLVELRRMNTAEIVYNKFSTLIIHTPSKYLFDTMNIIQDWGFKCVDSICISNPEKTYSSKYTDQTHELLLICELDVAGIPSSYIVKRPSSSIIPENEVKNSINGMFDSNVSKACVFTEPFEGWDSFDFDDESKQMVKFIKKAA